MLTKIFAANVLIKKCTMSDPWTHVNKCFPIKSMLLDGTVFAV